MQDLTVKAMLDAGVHFGHQTKRWNPKMKPYIYGARNGIYVLDLQQTAKRWKEASGFLGHVSGRGDTVLFVGTKHQAQEVIESEATRARMPFVTHRWLGGMLTNFVTIRKSLQRIDEIDKLLAEGSVEKLPKKEVLTLEGERNKLLRNMGGVRSMTRLPGALFIVDPGREHIAVREANVLKIPVVALTDTNCDPDVVDYVIPSNDDAIRAISLFASAAAEACIAGRMVTQRDTGVREAVPATGRAAAEGQPEVVVRKPRRPAADTGPEEAPEGTGGSGGTGT
jgi:small subunit ribosomal protein S2